MSRVNLPVWDRKRCVATTQPVDTYGIVSITDRQFRSAPRGGKHVDGCTIEYAPYEDGPGPSPIHILMPAEKVSRLLGFSSVPHKPQEETQTASVPTQPVDELAD